jgi:hypothetical protein
MPAPFIFLVFYKGLFKRISVPYFSFNFFVLNVKSNVVNFCVGIYINLIFLNFKFESSHNFMQILVRFFVTRSIRMIGYSRSFSGSCR